MLGIKSGIFAISIRHFWQGRKIWKSAKTQKKNHPITLENGKKIIVGKSEEIKKKVCKLGRQKAAAKKKKRDRLHDVGIWLRSLPNRWADSV